MTQAKIKSSIPATKLTLLGVAVIVLGTLVIYLPAIQGGYVWDDPAYVTNNFPLRSWPGLVDIWTNPTSIPQWYPVVHTTYWIEYHLWGLAPLGYHIDNVLLHIASSLLLWRLLKKLNVPGAWLAGAIFAMHPVMVESVAWVTERKNVLSGVFYFLSILAYLRFADDRKNRLAYGIAIGLFILALLSKSVVATMPAAILVILWWKRGKIDLKDIRPLVPFFLLGIAMGAFTAYLEVHHVGARSDRIAELNLSFLDRMLIAGRAVCFYAGKLVVPWPLVFIYPQWKGIDPRIAWQWIFPAAVVFVIVGLILSRKRIGRGPAAAVMIFCGTLFPALGFLNVYPMRFSYVADHFQYHASAALIALLAAIIWRWAKVYGSAVLIPLAVITAIQTPNYIDGDSLWAATLARNPDSWMVQINVGHVLLAKGTELANQQLIDESTEHYRRAYELDPENHETLTYYARSLGSRGEYSQAMKLLEKALYLQPNYAPAYYGLAQVYRFQNNLEQAIANYQNALRCDWSYAEPHYQLARIYEAQGDLGSAIEHYRSAAAGMPEDADVRYNLGSLLIKTKQFPEAVYNLREAVRLRPDWVEAWTNLGGAELLAGHSQDAAGSFQKALSIKPDFVPAQRGLQQALRR